jgi:cell division protein FtsL
MAAAVFTTQKYEMAKENMQPVEFTAPVQATERAVEVSYALTPLAKVIMAAFTFVVVAMLAMICMNTQIIRQKRIRLQNLEEQKEELVNEVAEIEQRIEAAKSEEAIRQYALENGIVLGN